MCSLNSYFIKEFKDTTALLQHKTLVHIKDEFSNSSRNTKGRNRSNKSAFVSQENVSSYSYSYGQM